MTRTLLKGILLSGALFLAACNGGCGEENELDELEDQLEQQGRLEYHVPGTDVSAGARG